MTVVQGVISDNRASKVPIRNYLEREIAQHFADFAYSSSHIFEFPCQFIRSKTEIGSHVEKRGYRLLHDRKGKATGNMV
jgi:hypothetical protein